MRAGLDRPIAIGRLQRHAVETYAASGGAVLHAGRGRGRAAPRSWARDRRASPAPRSCARAGRRRHRCTTRTSGPAAWATTGSCPGACRARRSRREVAEVERAGARFVLGLDGRAATWSPRRCSRATTRSWSPSGWAAASALGVPGEDLDGRRGRARPHRARDRRRAPSGASSAGGSASSAAAARRSTRRPRPCGWAPTRSRCSTGGARSSARRTRTRSTSRARSGVAIRWLTAPVEIRGERRSRAERRLRRDDPRRAGRVRAPPPGAGRRTPGSRSRWTPSSGRSARRDRPAWPGCSRRSASRSATASPSADPATGRTTNPKVWAIGDITSGGAEVVNAVQAGKLAARSIVDALGLGGPRIVPGPPDRRHRPGRRPVHRHGRHPQPEPVLAGQLPDHQQRRDGRPGVRRGLGRRRLEDDRRADPERHRAPRHVRARRPPDRRASTTSSSSATARRTSTSPRSARSRGATRTTRS